MNYRIISLIIMAIYYSFYIAKLLILNKKSIKTNQAGIGNKYFNSFSSYQPA